MAAKTTSYEKRVAKLRLVLEKIRDGKIVQNRQLRTLLGDEAYARLEDDWREQKVFREGLKDKPDTIVKYEQRLKEATFAYAKADAASRAGRHKAAKKMFGNSDTLFERLLEFLSEIMAADPSLEMWFDRNAIFDATNSPHTSAEDCPCVITSHSLRNKKGGFLDSIRTIRKTKEDAVERALEELTAAPMDENLLAKRLAAGRKNLKLLRR